MEETFSKCSGDFIALILLSLAIILVIQNPIFNKKKSHFFIAFAIIVFVLTVNEIIICFITNLHNPKLYYLSVVGNLFYLIFTPVGGIIIASLFLNKKKNSRVFLIANIPIISNTLFSVLSLWNGMYFTISPDCSFNEGPFFGVYIIHLFYTLCYLSSEILSEKYKYEKKDFHMLFIPSVVTFFSFFIQIVFDFMQIGYAGVSVSILIVYLIQREAQTGIDPLTGMRTRFFFQKRMEKIKKDDNTSIIVFDINNLKKVNDSFGHLCGDNLICENAKIILESFKNSGTAYRIGGDEFCVITHNIPQDKIDSILIQIQEKAKNHPPIHGIPFSIAYGYATYDKKSKGSVYDSFTIADSKMYSNKRYVKAALGS